MTNFSKNKMRRKTSESRRKISNSGFSNIKNYKVLFRTNSIKKNVKKERVLPDKFYRKNTFSGKKYSNPYIDSMKMEEDHLIDEYNYYQTKRNPSKKLKKKQKKKLKTKKKKKHSLLNRSEKRIDICNSLPNFDLKNINFN